MPGAERIPSYVTLHEWQKEGVDGADSDDEAIADCEAAFIDPEEANGLPRRQVCVTRVIQEVLSNLRLVMQYFLPSFLLPRSQEPRRLHPTAWLGMSVAKHPSAKSIQADTASFQMAFVASLPFW